MRMEYRKFSKFIEKVQYGFTADETSTISGDAKYLRITDIVPYFVDKDRVPYCTIPQKKKEQYLVKENDLLIARTGATTGYNLIIPKGFEDYIFASYLVRIYYNQRELYPLYLKHVLKSQQYYSFVNNYIGGSAQPGMNPRAFGRFEVPYFDYDQQKQIAAVLSTYDNLIEVNNKRIKVLEEMAENLYKEWFVRFRFPGHESVPFENGLPQGWRKAKLKDIAIEVEKPIKAERRTEYQHYLPIDTLPSRRMALLEEDEIDNAESSLLAFEEGDILIGAMRPYFHKVILAPFKGLTRSTCFVVNSINPKYRLYLYLLLFQDSSINYATTVSVGSTMPYARWKDFSRLNIIFPAISVIERFNHYVEPIMTQIIESYSTCCNLSRQRDMLLPRLMSGKLEV